MPFQPVSGIHNSILISDSGTGEALVSAPERGHPVKSVGTCTAGLAVDLKAPTATRSTMVVFK